MPPDATPPAALRSAVTLAAGDRAAPLGADRIRLLEAVGREGSISAAARAIGISYKHAWDGIAALNALAGQPLVASRTGGARGGGAVLTPAGARFVETFRRLEAETAEALRRLEAARDGAGGPEARRVTGGVLRTSARNALAGTVVAIGGGPLGAEVTLELAGGLRLIVVITRGSVEELGLFPGRRAVALIKAPSVTVAAADTLAAPGLNPVAGVVARVATDGAVAEVALDIGGGHRLTAVLARRAAEDLALAPGRRVVAGIDPAHILLAVD